MTLKEKKLKMGFVRVIELVREGLSLERQLYRIAVTARSTIGCNENLKYGQLYQACSRMFSCRFELKVIVVPKL